MAQSVKHLASAQVMVSWFVDSSPASGSVFTARSLEPASDSVSPPLSTPLVRILSLSFLIYLFNCFKFYFATVLWAIISVSSRSWVGHLHKPEEKGLSTV